MAAPQQVQGVVPQQASGTFCSEPVDRLMSNVEDNINKINIPQARYLWQMSSGNGCNGIDQIPSYG